MTAYAAADDDFEPDEEGLVYFDGVPPGEVDLPAYRDLVAEGPPDYDWPPLVAQETDAEGVWEVDDGADLASVEPEVNGDVTITSGYRKERPATYHGPIEPVEVVDDEGRSAIGLVMPTDENDGIRTVEAGRWRCLRCDHEEYLGTMNDGTPIRPTQNTTCEACERQGPWAHVGVGQDVNVEALLDPPWRDAIPATPLSDDAVAFDDLFDEVQRWVRDYWVVAPDSEYLYPGLAAWAISTWLRENVDELAQLCVMGKFQGGKTRLLNTLRRVSYRGTTMVDQSASYLYRSADSYNLTFLLSEYHDLDEETQQQIRGVFKGSQKRGENVGRTDPAPGGGYDPSSFDIFTHIGLATQWTIKEDMVSRSIQIHTSKPHRAAPDRFGETVDGGQRDVQARHIRAGLLRARYRLLGPRWAEWRDRASPVWREAEQEARTFLEERGIENRTKEKMWAITTIAVLWGRKDEIEPFVKKMDEQAREAEAESEDARVAAVIRDMVFHQLASDGRSWDDVRLPYGDVCERYNEVTDSDKTGYWLRNIVARHDLPKRRFEDGTAIVGARGDGADEVRLDDRLRKLCADVGIDFEVDPEEMHLSPPEPSGDDDEPENFRYWVRKVVRDEADVGEPIGVSEVLAALSKAGVEPPGDTTPSITVRETMKKLQTEDGLFEADPEAGETFVRAQ